MGGVAIGALIGVATSLAAWWLVARAPIPRVVLSSAISQVPENRRAHSWRYRVKVVNLRRWPLRHRPVIEVRVVATLEVRGLDPAAPDHWNRYGVPVANGGEGALLDENAVIHVRAFDIDLDDRPLLAGALPDDGVDRLDLQGLLRVGLESRLRLMVTTANTYTHATTTTVAAYGADDIRLGDFSARRGRAGLAIVPPAGGEAAPTPEAAGSAA